MTSSRDILAPTLSNGRSYYFDVAVDDRNPGDKMLLMISVTEESRSVWTTSFYENDISTMSNFVAETLVLPNKAQPSDVVAVATLLYSIVSHSKEIKREENS